MSILFKLFPSKSLLFVYLIPATTDWVFTVLGQSEEYWQGFKVINESNPFARILLSIHPVIFLLGCLGVYLIFALIIKKLKEPFNLAFALFLLAAHSWGLSSWTYLILYKYGFYDPNDTTSVAFVWTFQVIYFLLVGLVAAVALKKYISSKVVK